MGRLTKADSSEFFRAVVTTNYEKTETRNAYSTTAYHGPFETKGAAKAAITRETRVWPGYRFPQTWTTESKVQRTSVVWEDVEP